ncbi:MAG TPA: pyridoxal 5'-phosphate synthase glutaminase subunit PdxT [Candidatus Magasanikbacteria bacterium]|nr:pyridoxal 5'-phosphate synthase glutaminase subunit PdxT [Candidatus Magasanikbacteria bacterium]
MDMDERHTTNKKQIGIIAFQGGVSEHGTLCRTIGLEARPVRAIEDMRGLTHLIVPGGESTVIGRFLLQTGLKDAILDRWKQAGLYLFGTCAGAILLGKNASPYSLNCIDVVLDRNAYGSQLHSFSKNIKTTLGDESFPAVFIRAPKITSAGEGIAILATHEGNPVLCEKNRVLLSTFHPELTHDTRIHNYFLFDMK